MSPNHLRKAYFFVQKTGSTTPLADILTGEEAYKNVLQEFRTQPEIANLGLGPQHSSHSLDQLINLQWPQRDHDRYKYQHVEFLLDQSADLLDRGVRDRTLWEDLYEKPDISDFEILCPSG